MSRYGFPSFMGGQSATSYSRVSSSVGSAHGVTGMTMRRGGGGGLGQATRRGVQVTGVPGVSLSSLMRMTGLGHIPTMGKMNNPFNVRVRVSWNSLSFGGMKSAMKRGGVGSFSGGSSNQSVGANAIRQLIRHYGKVPNEIRKDLRTIMRTGGMQLKRRAEWYWRASSRAQRAIKVSTSLGWKNAGTRVWVDNSIMPHNRAWERILGDSYFIHVPWGNYAAAGPKPNRPALRPATRDVGPRIVQDMNRQLIRTINRFQSGRV